MYFMIKQVNEVMSTEQPCDMAYEFGDGVWDLYDYPQGFPKPGGHSCLARNAIRSMPHINRQYFFLGGCYLANKNLWLSEIHTCAYMIPPTPTNTHTHTPTLNPVI